MFNALVIIMFYLFNNIIEDVKAASNDYCWFLASHSILFGFTDLCLFFASGCSKWLCSKQYNNKNKSKI